MSYSTLNKKESTMRQKIERPFALSNETLPYWESLVEELENMQQDPAQNAQVVGVGTQVQDGQKVGVVVVEVDL